jgi:hypothetical protein
VDKWITSRLTGERFRNKKPPVLDTATHALQIRTLSSVAAYLASALDVLSMSGCNWFSTEILEMLAVIDGQIAVLEELGSKSSSSSLSA